MTRGVVGVGRAVWLERIALVAVGAGLYAVLHAGFGARETSPPRRADTPLAVATEDTPAPTVGEPEIVEVPAPEAGPETMQTAPGDRAPDTDDASASKPVPSAGAPGLDVAEPEPEPEPSAAPLLHARPKGDAPDLPLTRMPGANQLRAGKKWDAKRSAWVVTRAYEVPAARAHVAAFYSKAIEDQGLEVSRVEGAPDTDGVTPLYIKGRSTGQHAHITIRKDPDELRTRVRVIWRTYADARRVVAPDSTPALDPAAEGDEA